MRTGSPTSCFAWSPDVAQTWLSKAPTEVVERRWTVPLACGDSISGVSTSASAVTVDSDDHELDEAIVVLSGGTEDATGSVTVTVATADGRTHVQTFLIAIHGTAQQFTYTTRDVVDFALRKIVGNGVEADAAEAADALERLNDMIALWRIDGLDIGIPDPLALVDPLAIPDEYVSALKFNLRISCHDHYDQPISGFDLQMADRSKQLIANTLFNLGDLSMPLTLSRAGTVVF
jgi:hypothetical protein